MKKHLANKLKIITFVFALIGWLLLITVPLEQLFHKDLSKLEQFFETSSFKWGIKIFVVILLVILIKYQEKISVFLEKNNWFKIGIKIIFIGGIIGWIFGLGSLFF